MPVLVHLLTQCQSLSIYVVFRCHFLCCHTTIVSDKRRRSRTTLLCSLVKLAGLPCALSDLCSSWDASVFVLLWQCCCCFRFHFASTTMGLLCLSSRRACLCLYVVWTAPVVTAPTVDVGDDEKVRASSYYVASATRVQSTLVDDIHDVKSSETSLLGFYRCQTTNSRLVYA
jgi:hypothetical protein